MAHKINQLIIHATLKTKEEITSGQTQNGKEWKKITFSIANNRYNGTEDGEWVNLLCNAFNHNASFVDKMKIGESAIIVGSLGQYKAKDNTFHKKVNVEKVIPLTMAKDFDPTKDKELTFDDVDFDNIKF